MPSQSLCAPIRLGAELWRLLTFGNATFVQGGFRSLEAFLDPSAWTSPTVIKASARPPPTRASTQRLVHVGAGVDVGVWLVGWATPTVAAA